MDDFDRRSQPMEFRTPPPGDALANAGAAGPKANEAEGTAAPKDSPTEVAGMAPEGPRSTDAAGSEAAEKAGDSVGAGVAKATDGASKAANAVTKAAVPAGSAGLVVAIEGILLRYNSDSREWERLTGPTPLAASSRLLSLYPSRATIMVGKTQVMMTGECEIRILPQSTDLAPAIELTQGWLVIRPESSSAHKVSVGDRRVALRCLGRTAVHALGAARRKLGCPGGC